MFNKSNIKKSDNIMASSNNSSDFIDNEEHNEEHTYINNLDM
jgi:hypothetical protein